MGKDNRRIIPWEIYENVSHIDISQNAKESEKLFYNYKTIGSAQDEMVPFYAHVLSLHQGS